MSLEPLPTFLTLPVELIDRILDLLDTESILFSFSAVCKRFHAIAYNYSRLTINFTDTSSKADIQRIRRAMRPENVIALTLKNSSRQSNIIRHFLSSVYIYQSTQLRSLTLCNIEEYDLQTIIKSLTTSKLASLSLSVSKAKPLSTHSIDLLSAMVAISSLRRLILDIDRRISDHIL
ncbi:unnamed protein product [Rotaria sp. Silwood2]|nr:unnamed protein product [Rotaria sp. Silwood2]CAF2936963.1 unnamed protein product [Rotaria sp. Silwood2]CAF3364996.1 unnamed protein product [Rotaria sp. Silwood2]CAF4554711.1 unnamed protein product [Rotaria sp. Silwood2]